MARPRYQRGFVEEVGKLVTKWKVHYYVWITDEAGNDERRHRSRVIGRKPTNKELLLSAADAALPVMTRAEAQAELDRIIRVEVGGVDARRDGSMQFGKFLRERWLPLRASTWRENTRLTNTLVIERYLEPRWGNDRLDSIDAPKAAAWLGKLAEEYSASLVHKARTYLRSVIAEAVEQGYLPKDPLRRLKRPKVQKRPDRTYLRLEQIHALRASITGFRDLLILDILLTTGMRPGELFALRWADVLTDSLYVDEGFTRGRLEEPKTAASIAAVAVPADVMDRLKLWRREQRPASEEEMLFPSEEGTPIFSENWRKRVLYPAGKAAGVRVTFQIIRRTLATLSLNEGVPLKAVQAQMRHSSADTTLNVYAQLVTEAQGAAAEKMFRLIKPKKKLVG